MYSNLITNSPRAPKLFSIDSGTFGETTTGERRAKRLPAGHMGGAAAVEKRAKSGVHFRHFEELDPNRETATFPGKCFFLSRTSLCRLNSTGSSVRQKSPVPATDRARSKNTDGSTTKNVRGRAELGEIQHRIPWPAKKPHAYIDQQTRKDTAEHIFDGILRLSAGCHSLLRSDKIMDRYQAGSRPGRRRYFTGQDARNAEIR